jgi:hypothetical protein
VAGFDVLDAIEHVTTDKNSAPIVGIKIESAEIVDAGSLGAMSLRPARPIGMPGEKSKTIFEIFAAVMFLTTVAIPILKTTVTHSSSIKPAEKPLHAIPLVPGTQK